MEWRQADTCDHICERELLTVKGYVLEVQITGAGGHDPDSAYQWSIEFTNENMGTDSVCVDWEPVPTKAQAKTDAVAALKKHLADTLAELEKLGGGGE
jgi:hypothetical protein